MKVVILHLKHSRSQIYSFRKERIKIIGAAFCGENNYMFKLVESECYKAHPFTLSINL